MVLDQEEEQDSRYLAATFKVDPGRLESLGRSMGLLLLHRRCPSLLLHKRCPSCRATLINKPDQGLSINAKEHLKRIAEDCSKESNYITHGMPIMEAVFRILLSHRGGPLSVEEILEELQERWSDPTNPRDPTPDKTYRILAGDRFYGIVMENPPSEPAEESS